MRAMLRIALRDLRGGLAGFRVFLVCLILGVAGIAAVGSIAEAISRGLEAEGREILGGDVAVSFTYRFASPEERAWMESAGDVSEIADMRSMLGVVDQPGERALSQVKGVDSLWPLYGEAETNGAALPELLAERNGRFGLITEPVLADRLGLEPGDLVTLGTGVFEFRGRLMAEPDAASQGFNLGPRTLVSLDGLREAGLLEPGTLFNIHYRLRLGEANLASLKTDFTQSFPESGARWRDHRNAAPGIERLVDRLSAFLILVGLAALAIGGVGIGAAVRGYLNRKTRTIAALRTLGATGNMVLVIYLMQIGVIAVIGIAAGLALGAGSVALAGPFLAERLPVPAVFGVYAGPLVTAGIFGALTAIVFTLWPLAWLRRIRPATLFRDLAGTDTATDSKGLLITLGVLLVASSAIIVALSSAPELAAWVLGALVAAFVVLRSLGWLLTRLSRAGSHSKAMRRRPGWRLALGAIGAPTGQTPGIVVALGLALGVIAAIGQIDGNLQRLIRDQLPAGSPAFFFVDIQNDQIDRFKGMLAEDGADSTSSAPMLRGVVTELDGVPAREAVIDPAGAWVLRGDRGVSYADAPPPGTELTDGDWWAPDYAGPPLVSFAEEEGRELGLEIGSTITVNILGRPITAEVANFRKVEWRGMGINFLMILNPGALAGAPHTHIATVHTPPATEAGIMRDIGKSFPNITVIRVRDQVERVATALGDLGSATRWAALAVLITGLAVLIGAAAAGAERQVQEAAILRTLGASKARVLSSFALRAVILGGAAGLVALIWGSIAAWAVSTYVFDASFVLAPSAALIAVGGGALLNLIASTSFAARALNKRPAHVLRNTAG
ncbi:FtsX-like permease family protein [Rhodobacteraceae bacterium NNCM2]|nr:FtsX-like permease family protein [Coraliihabitans acroporae]